MSEKTDVCGIFLDFTRCKGCQYCSEEMPDVFGYNEDMERAYLKVDMGPREEVERICMLCPTQCIDAEN